MPRYYFIDRQGYDIGHIDGSLSQAISKGRKYATEEAKSLKLYKIKSDDDTKREYVSVLYPKGRGAKSNPSKGRSPGTESSYPRVGKRVKRKTESRVSTALNKFMKCKAVRFNRNGSVSIKK